MTSKPAALPAPQSPIYTPFSHRICKRFLPTHARTAKCDDCGQPNRTSMVRCIDCARHTCQSCMAAQGWVLEEKGTLKDMPDLLPLVHRNVPLTTRPLFLIDSDKMMMVRGHDRLRAVPGPVAAGASLKSHEDVLKPTMDVAKVRKEDKSIRRRPVPSRREPVSQQRNITQTDKRPQDSGSKQLSRDAPAKETKNRDRLVRGMGGEPCPTKVLEVREMTNKSQPASSSKNRAARVEDQAGSGTDHARDLPNTLVDAAHALLSLSTPARSVLTTELADKPKRVQGAVENHPFASQPGPSRPDGIKSAKCELGLCAQLNETKREVVASGHPLTTALPQRSEKHSIQFLLCPMD